MQHYTLSPTLRIHVIMGSVAVLPAYASVNAFLPSVVNRMRRSSPILLSIALLFACGHASACAVESQQISADASTACPDSATAANDRGEPGDADPSATTVAPVRRAEKAKTVAAPRSTGNRAVAPRWHSFLPGMIR